MIGAVKRAWCELTGGHDREVFPAWAGEERARFIRLQCRRCGNKTGWFSVPTRTEYRKAHPDMEIQP